MNNRRRLKNKQPVFFKIVSKPIQIPDEFINMSTEEYSEHILKSYDRIIDQFFKNIRYREIHIVSKVKHLKINNKKITKRKR